MQKGAGEKRKVEIMFKNREKKTDKENYMVILKKIVAFSCYSAILWIDVNVCRLSCDGV